MITIQKGQIINAGLLVGTNGPYQILYGTEYPISIWYDVGSATGIIVNRSPDGGKLWIPVSMAQSVAGLFENTGTITSGAGQLQIILATSTTNFAWGIN